MVYMSLSYSGMVWLGALILWTLAAALAFWPDHVRRWAVAFPRNRWAAMILTAVALFWVVQIVHHARLGRVEPVKSWLWPMWPVATATLVTFMDELLAVRALGGLMLLAMNPLLRAGRLHPSQWTPVVAVMAYAVIIAGLAWILGPYRFRQWISWCASPKYRLPTVVILALSAATLTTLAWLEFS